MATFINTMFVSPFQFPRAARATPPVPTPALFSSCIHLPAREIDPSHCPAATAFTSHGGLDTRVAQPEPSYLSPLHSAFNHVLSKPPVDDMTTHRSNSRTRGGATAPFKPQKANRGTSSWQLKQFAEATLGSGSLRKAVKLPEGEDLNEWLAVNGGSLLLSSPQGEVLDVLD